MQSFPESETLKQASEQRGLDPGGFRPSWVEDWGWGRSGGAGGRTKGRGTEQGGGGGAGEGWRRGPLSTRSILQPFQKGKDLPGELPPPWASCRQLLLTPRGPELCRGRVWPTQRWVLGPSVCLSLPALHPLPTVRGAAACHLLSTGVRPLLLGVPPPRPDPISTPHLSAGSQETEKLPSLRAVGTSELHPPDPAPQALLLEGAQVLGRLVPGPQGGRPGACWGGKAAMGSPSGGAALEGGAALDHPTRVPKPPGTHAQTRVHPHTHTLTLTHSHTPAPASPR